MGYKTQGRNVTGCNWLTNFLVLLVPCVFVPCDFI